MSTTPESLSPKAGSDSVLTPNTILPNQSDQSERLAGENELHGVRRVAIVLSALRAGGMEQVVVHLAKGLKQHGVLPLVICLQSKGRLAPVLEAAGIHVVQIGCNRSYDITGLFRLAKHLKRFSPDVIHVHDYSSLPYAAVAGLAQTKCPVVFTAHGLLYRGFAGKERRYRFFARRLHALCAVSEEVCRRHRDFLNWKRPISIVPNGVPSIEASPDLRHQVRAELNITDDEIVFLAVGNPRPEKAFEDLVAAVKAIGQNNGNPPFSVLIVGWLLDNEYCRNLRRDVADCRGSRIRLLGYQEDVHRLYSAADALVVSSRSEGLPMVVLEAMTAGLPILSTRVGGIPDAVPRDGGRLVQPNDPNDLARGLSEFLRMDRPARVAMGECAKRHAHQHFSVDVMVSRYIDVFAKRPSQSPRLDAESHRADAATKSNLGQA